MQKQSPYFIPDFIDIQTKYDFEIDKEQFLGLIRIVRNFPDLHKFLVESSGKSKFPNYHLITVISADIVRYIHHLFKIQQISEIHVLLSYLERIYISGTEGEKAISGDFILCYFYLLEDFLPTLESILPDNLRETYSIYFKEKQIL